LSQSTDTCFVAIVALAGLDEAMVIAGKKDWVVDLLVHWMVQFGLSRGQQLI